MNLNTPLKINNLPLHNRLVMPPIATYKSNNGQITQPMLDYYGSRAAGGHIGLLITEHCYINRGGMAKVNQLSMAADADLEGLKRLTETIKKDGTHVFAQLSHAGSATESSVTGGSIISASSVVNPSYTGQNHEVPMAMNTAMIGDVIKDFAAAAVRAKVAGYDGVELHSAHGYLLNQFFSPMTNQRTDAYSGSSIEGRTKLHLEVIRAVRAAVGADYPIAMRLGASDYTAGGTTIEDSVAAAQLLEQAGIDMLDISGGMCRYTRPGHSEPGYFAELTEAIKQVVTIPVLLTGGITTRESADVLLQNGAADLIGMGRALMKESGITLLADMFKGE